jgi:DNA polymerase III subunit gamma/tau
MSYLVLARKWRPQSFADIAGQGHITRTLQNAIRANRIAHAYLFTGVRGVGKTTAARILGKALNCEKGPTPAPCNECAQCREITAGNCLDVLEIDGASNRGIDEIRQIIENVRYQPAKCRFKIYIIDEVHQVTKDAFNALLKTLEEPPPSVKFILATTEPHRLPETILSRCQRFDFRRISLREIVQRLQEIAGSEGLQITEGALVALAREADGSMRDAQSLLEQVLSSAGAESNTRSTVDEQLLGEILGFAERQMLFAVSKAVLSGNGKDCLQLIAAAVDQGRDVNRLSKELVEHFRNLMVAQLCQKKTGSASTAAISGGLLDLPDQEIDALNSQVAGVSVETLLDYFDFMSAGDEEVARSPNPRFALEAVLVRMATLPQSLPVTEFIKRLERLESRVDAVRPKTPQNEQTSSLLGSRPVEKETHQTTPAAADSDKEGLWRNFVAFVGKEKKLLASHLESGSVIELPPQTLTIGIAEKHHLSYLQDSENLSLLKSFASRFFSADVAVKLMALAAPASASSFTAGQPSGREGDSEVVREALRIFGGSIKGSRKENA